MYPESAARDYIGYAEIVDHCAHAWALHLLDGVVAFVTPAKCNFIDMLQTKKRTGPNCIELRA